MLLVLENYILIKGKVWLTMVEEGTEMQRAAGTVFKVLPAHRCPSCSAYTGGQEFTSQNKSRGRVRAPSSKHRTNDTPLHLCPPS